MVSKLACIVKHRDDGSWKVRNVLDLRRSGCNSHAALAERVVLPRMKDLVDDVVDLAKNLQHGEGIRGMIADFEGRTFLCGCAGCPVLWGRRPS